MIKKEESKIFNSMISPVEDEGLNYIWYAIYKNGDIITEYEDNRKKNSFDEIYDSRIFVDKFGLLGNKKLICYDINTGIFERQEYDKDRARSFIPWIKANGIIYDLCFDEKGYEDLTARKYIHADAIPGKKIQTIEPTIDCFAVGYKKHLSFDLYKIDLELDIECLYEIMKDDTEMMRISLTPNKDFECQLFLDRVGTKINLIKDNRSDFRILIKKAGDESPSPSL